MIEEIIYSTVKSDRALQDILGGTSKDSRIYPNVAQVKSIPCVIYYASAPTNPITERWAYQQTISFSVRLVAFCPSASSIFYQNMEQQQY